MANFSYKSPGLSRHSFKVICLFFFVSLFCHGAFLLFVPNFLSDIRINIVPVKYIKPLEIHIRKTLPRVETNKFSKSRGTKQTRGREMPDFIRKKLDDLSIGRQLFLPAPLIQLPASVVMREREKISDLYTSKSEPEKEFGQYSFPAGIPELLPDLKKNYRTLPSFSGASKSYSDKIAKGLKKEIKAKEKAISRNAVPIKSHKKLRSSVKLDIEGPVTERKILSKPPLPKVNTEHTIQIKLKFWVTPNGIVDQIIPVERGDTKLESAAIRYLKNWRFDPLSPHLKQNRQWGILTVRFLVR